MAALLALSAVEGLLALLAQDPDVAALVQGLADDRIDVRASSEARLWELPARLLPRVLEEAARHDEQEIRAVADRMRISPAWSAFLPGTIRDARSSAERIGSLQHPERSKAAALALERLDARPPGEASGLLLRLLEEPSDGVRQFALAGLRRFPPADPAPLLPFLRQGATSGLAAEVLVAMDAASAVPLAVELFCEEGPATLGAARILERYGAGEHAPRIAAVVRERVGLLVWGVRILRATGRSAEPLLVELAPHVSTPRQREIAEALVEIGTDRSLPLVRQILDDGDPAARDRFLAQARDPEWARQRLAAAKNEAAAPFRPLELAAVGGPSLADFVRAWSLEPDVKVGQRREFLLPLLGACGGAGDVDPLISALRDPRLAEAAADALDMIGDPRRARPVFAAAKRVGFPSADRLVRGLPPDDLEAELLEVLADPRGYPLLFLASLELAARRLTPPLRAALYSLLASPDAGFNVGEVLRILADAVGKSDLPEIARLRASKDPFVRRHGHVLAARLGEPDAAKALCLELTGSTGNVGRYTLHIPYLEIARPPAEAVRAVWAERKPWPEGTFWLAARGDPEALEAARAGPLADPRGEPLRERALVRGGDADAVERLFQRGLRGFLPPEDEALLLPSIDAARKAKLLAARGSAGADHLAARLELPEAAGRLLDAAARAPLSDPSSETILRAVGRLNPPGASETLYRLLRSPHAAVRGAAAKALAETAPVDRAVRDRILRLVDDPHPTSGLHGRPLRRVWDDAMEALEKIDGAKAAGTITAERRAFWRARHEPRGDR